MDERIIRTDACVAEGAAYLAEIEPRFADALRQTGPLPLRLRKDGFQALLSAIVSQQVSVASANAIWARLKAAKLTGPRKIAWASDEELRACGLSRQKIRYARALAEARIDDLRYMTRVIGFAIDANELSIQSQLTLLRAFEKDPRFDEMVKALGTIKDNELRLQNLRQRKREMLDDAQARMKSLIPPE